jgi:hypothetical protein
MPVGPAVLLLMADAAAVGQAGRVAVRRRTAATMRRLMYILKNGSVRQEQSVSWARLGQEGIGAISGMTRKRADEKAFDEQL